MAIYILHFSKKVSDRAQHYVGYTDNVERRVKEHLACGENASPLVKAAIERGYEVEIANTFDGDRKIEKEIKRQKNTSRFCSICRGDK